MHTKISNAFKVSTLAIVLSFGLSYVYAWTAPTSNPPAGNVAAPINTSAVSQTKAGDIAVNSATHFLDTGTTIPETPASGTSGAAAVAGNGWPNFSDVAANAMRLNGYTSGDILSAQSAGAGGMQMFTNYGDTTCPTGWSVARTCTVSYMFPAGAGIPTFFDSSSQASSANGMVGCIGSSRVGINTQVWGAVQSNDFYRPLVGQGASPAQLMSCAVCVR